MKPFETRFLKICCVVSAIVTSAIWVLYFIQAYKISEHFNLLEMFLKGPTVLTYPIINLLGFVLVLKSKGDKGVLLFSFFMTLISQNAASSYFFAISPKYDIYFLLTLSFILTSMVHIKALQNFPQKVTEADLLKVFPKTKVLRVYLNVFLKRSIWIFYPAVVLGFATAFPRNMTMQNSLLLITLFTGLAFMYVNFQISSRSDRNKIRWLVWGILFFSFLSFLHAILLFSGTEVPEAIATVLRILRSFSLLISMMMSLFFFNTFNTGVLIRRTIVDGGIFILIVLLYNTIEHYFLHWLNHTMHVSSTLISSILSGFFVLIFSPIHHKFMHVLDERFKHKEHEKDLRLEKERVEV